MFTSIVQHINSKLDVESMRARGDCSVIGVLDIYGFEIFENNRFVQSRATADQGSCPGMYV